MSYCQKDCIHGFFCNMHGYVDCYECACFQDKARYIELPCKVGDMVYVLENCTCYHTYSTHEQCHKRRTVRTRWIEMVRVPTKHYTKCVKLYERPFKLEYFNKLGKTVFLSREEAEKALKELKE